MLYNTNTNKMDRTAERFPISSRRDEITNTIILKCGRCLVNKTLQHFKRKNNGEFNKYCSKCLEGKKLYNRDYRKKYQRGGNLDFITDNENYDYINKVNTGKPYIKNEKIYEGLQDYNKTRKVFKEFDRIREDCGHFCPRGVVCLKCKALRLQKEIMNYKPEKWEKKPPSIFKKEEQKEEENEENDEENDEEKEEKDDETAKDMVNNMIKKLKLDKI